jgi:hypothetical protein
MHFSTARTDRECSNVVGGYSSNAAYNGAVGATIGGGGR